MAQKKNRNKKIIHFNFIITNITVAAWLKFDSLVHITQVEDNEE